MRGTLGVSEAWTQAAARPEPHVRRVLLSGISDLKSQIPDTRFQSPQRNTYPMGNATSARRPIILTAQRADVNSEPANR